MNGKYYRFRDITFLFRYYTVFIKHYCCQITLFFKKP